jgi:hypothetical protein
MSRDAVILKVRGPVRPIDEIAPEEYLPLGSLDAVAAAVKAAFPSAKWSNPSHAYYSLDKYTGVTFELKHLETSNSIQVSVSGRGNPVPELLALANAKGWVVFDFSTGEFLDSSSTL